MHSYVILCVVHTLYNGISLLEQRGAVLYCLIQ